MACTQDHVTGATQANGQHYKGQPIVPQSGVTKVQRELKNLLFPFGFGALCHQKDGPNLG